MGSSKKLPHYFFIVVAVITYNKIVTNTTNYHVAETTESDITVQPPHQFQCQGKTRCSEMTSCAEAKFYINNCPGTQMDGDHDGIPCESQWCN